MMKFRYGFTVAQISCRISPFGWRRVPTESFRSTETSRQPHGNRGISVWTILACPPILKRLLFLWVLGWTHLRAKPVELQLVRLLFGLLDPLLVKVRFLHCH